MSRLLFAGALAGLVYFPAVAQSFATDDSQHKIYFRRQVDSIQNTIDYKNEDTSLVNKLAMVSGYYAEFWFDSALFFAHKAELLAKRLRNSFSMLTAFRSKAVIFSVAKRYDSSIFYLRKALEICRLHGFESQELHHVRVGLNHNYFMQGNYAEAMNISTDGLSKAEKRNDLERMAHFNNVLGYIMMKLHHFEQSRHYFSAQLELTKEIKNKEGEAHALLNLADLALEENKPSGAIESINKALIIYREAEGDARRIKEAYAYNKLATVHKGLENYSKALQYILTSIELTQVHLLTEKRFLGNEYDVAAYFINAAAIYNKTNKPDSSLFYGWTGFSIARKLKHREMLRDAYEQISLSFASKKEFDSAYVYQQYFSDLKDSILGENNQRDILQRETDLQIERQKRIQEAELTRQHFWRNIIIAVSIAAMIIIIMLYNRRRIRQKMIYQQQLNKQQNEMFNLTASVQEQERKRIAQDLHDGLGSVLSAAKLKLSALDAGKKTLTDDQREKYHATLSLLDEAASELRNVSHNIMPATLSKLGLIAALRNITGNITSNSGLQLQFQAHGFEERLEEAIEISVYRILMELLNNIVRHAGATKAVVQLIKYPAFINITVEDNGVGFDHKLAISQSNGIGLANMTSRVNYMNGRIDIDSLPGRGTVTIIEIPLNPHEVKYQDVGMN